jgi:hypothetical protein
MSKQVEIKGYSVKIGARDWRGDEITVAHGTKCEVVRDDRGPFGGGTVTVRVRTPNAYGAMEEHIATLDAFVLRDVR